MLQNVFKLNFENKRHLYLTACLVFCLFTVNAFFFSSYVVTYTYAYFHPNGVQNGHITSLKIDHIFLENTFFEALFPT